MKEIGKIAITAVVVGIGLYLVHTYQIERGWAFVFGTVAAGINRLLQALNDDE
jgi:hypothetical protein